MTNAYIQMLAGAGTKGELQNAVRPAPKHAPLRIDGKRALDLAKELHSYKIGDGREGLLEFEEIVRQSQYNTQDRDGVVQLLVTILDGNATNDLKDFACRQLWIIGTEAAVPSLGNALKNPELSDMARYALQNIEGEEVDKVLIAALDGTPASVQVGVINSLTARKSSGAEDAIKPLRKSKDKDVAAAAKHALSRLDGKIA